MPEAQTIETPTSRFRSPPAIANWRKAGRTIFGFRSILFVSFLLIATIPIVLLTAWVEVSAVQKEIESVREKHLVVAKNLSGALSRYVVDVKLFVALAARGGNNLADQQLSAGLEKLHIGYVAIFDPENRLLSGIAGQTSVDAISLPADEQLATLRAFASETPGEMVISGIGKFQGTPHFFVVQALTDGRLVIAPLAPAYVNKMQKSIVFGERGHSMVVDQFGHVVAHPNADWQAQSKDASKLSVVKKMISRDTGVAQFYSPPMKADMIAGYTFVPETGWGVMVPQPMRELIDRAREVQSAGALISAVEIVVAIFLSWWLSNLLSRPILAVVKAAGRVSQGRLETRVEGMPAHMPNEMRVLESSFNKMVDDLKIKNDDLSAALVKAEEGSRTKSQFMAMMTHEIRTPINGMLGILELLKGEELNDEQKKFVTVAQNSGQSLIQIINDILDFSKLAAGKLQIKKGPFDVRQSLAEVHDLFQPMADQKQIRLVSKIAEDLPVKVIADMQRVRQVLFNLLGNAVKFTDEGQITTRLIFADGGDGRGVITVRIEDTGIGIKKNAQGKLFGDFSQCDASYSREHGGTGLGLAISKHLVELMGGDIGFESIAGKGSLFWFTFVAEIEEVTDVRNG